MRKIVAATILLAWTALPAEAGLLSGQGAAALDVNLSPRTSFTNTERIVFQQKVFNGVASPNRISFSFVVTGPSGAQVFSHAGNAVPGSVGASATQVSGVPISQFYVGPGVYTLKATAVLDAQTLDQTATFTVSSPNILLTYPPNGAPGVSDIPLIFRWSSSGAPRYRLTVGDNPSFYNSVFSQDTAGAENFLGYPENPSDPRQRLAAGQVYYWKVEGFDATGQQVAASPAPFSFTVAAAALTKDLAVTDLTLAPPPPGGAFPFTITVKNQGGTTEVSLPLKFSVGGLPADGTPITIPMLAPGETRQYAVNAMLPAGQSQSMAIACVEFSDNNIANNCRTMMVSRPPADSGGGSAFAGACSLTPEQLWQGVRELLKSKGEDLSDYQFVGLDGGLSAAELCALLDQLRAGDATATVTGPAAPTVAVAPPAQGWTPPPPQAAAPPPMLGPQAPPIAPKPAPLGELNLVGEQWSGFASPMSKVIKTFTVTDQRAWERICKRLGMREVPPLDFKNNMVLGLVAGRNDRADRVEIRQIVRAQDTDIVKYRLIVQERFLEVDGLRRAALRTTVPYLLRSVPRTMLSVQFEPIEE